MVLAMETPGRAVPWGSLFSLEPLGRGFGKVQSLQEAPDSGIAAGAGRSKSLFTQKNVPCEFIVLFLKPWCICRQLPGLSPWGGCSPVVQEEGAELAAGGFWRADCGL